MKKLNLVGVLFLGGLLAACGSEGDSSGTPPAPTASEAGAPAAANAGGPLPSETTTAPSAAVGPATDVGTPGVGTSAGGATATTALNGQSVYNGSCASCHGAGLAGSPKMGDKPGWEARLAKGKDVLYTNAINGYGGMPAKGGNPSLSDDEVKAAVDYMIAQAQ